MRQFNRPQTKAEMREESARLVRQARYGKRHLPITRLTCGARDWDSIQPRRGGILPSELDPRFLPDVTEAQVVATIQEHCDIAAPRRGAR